MSSPEPAPQSESQAPVIPQQEPPPDEGSALVPALLIAYAAYRTWRGAHDKVPSGWRQLLLVLGLRGLIGGQLAMVATRAVGWQQRTSGRTGDDLWPVMDDAVNAGVDAGLQAVAEALIWTDAHAGGTPSTKDVSSPGEAAIPTAANPPVLLAQMTALAVTNAATFAAAAAAKWTKKTWMTREDSRVRDTHRALDRTTVPMAAVFSSPSGAKLRFPGDPRAPIAETANCRCWLRMERR